MSALTPAEEEHKAQLEKLAEISLIVEVITHPSGFGIDLFGNLLYIHRNDNGKYAVGRDPLLQNGVWEEEFNKPEDAAKFFVEKRHEMKIGYEYERASK